jgi:hypothetical protein
VRRKARRRLTVLSIKTPSGGYREPDFGVLAEMQARDMWKLGILEPQYEEPAAKRKTKAIEKAKDTVAEDVRAASRIAGEGG